MIFSFLALGVPGFIMNIYTDKAEIQQIGISYLRIVGFAYILQILSMAVSALLRSIEQVKIPLYGGIASVIANCFFNYLLIFGKFGFPKMGVRGAALGTVLAGMVNLLVLLFFIVKNKIPYVLEFSRYFRWDKEYFGHWKALLLDFLADFPMQLRYLWERKWEQETTKWLSRGPSGWCTYAVS